MMTACKWPTKPLSQVQVTIGEISMMATPDRAYFDAVAVNDAVMAERERCAAIEAERDRLLRGEFICAKCGLRKDAEIDDDEAKF